MSASTISRQKWRPCQKIHHRNHTEITLTAWFYQKQQMAELEQAVKKIDAKLRMLKFTTEEVPRIREKKELKALERLQKDLEKQLDGVHEQKVQKNKARRRPERRERMDIGNRRASRRIRKTRR